MSERCMAGDCLFGNCLGCKAGEVWCEDPRCYPNCPNCPNETSESKNNWVLTFIILVLTVVLLVLLAILWYNWSKEDEYGYTVNNIYNIHKRAKESVSQEIGKESVSREAGKEAESIVLANWNEDNDYQSCLINDYVPTVAKTNNKFNFNATPVSEPVTNNSKKIIAGFG